MAYIARINPSEGDILIQLWSTYLQLDDYFQESDMVEHKRTHDKERAAEYCSACRE